jgi:hypothetical protein
LAYDTVPILGVFDKHNQRIVCLRYKPVKVPSSWVHKDRYDANEIFFTEDFGADLLQAIDFIVIDTNEERAIATQQISRQSKAWIHHVQPISVEAAGGFVIAHPPAAS